MKYLDPGKMSEAEVSLRLAEFLALPSRAVETVEVAIDGAQVEVGNTLVFPLLRFMNDHGWELFEGDKWRGRYSQNGFRDILVHSSPGRGDVVAKLPSGKTIRVESKKGTLQRSKGSQEYPLLREALGQLLTVPDVSDNDILGVAVPDSDKFKELASRWRKAPLIKRCGIKIILVSRDGSISGI
jgi:hypothetical protein